METLKVVKNTLGHPTDTQRIIFESVEALGKAKEKIDNGLDIYLEEEDGTIILISAKDLTNQIYGGKVLLGAKPGRR